VGAPSPTVAVFAATDTQPTAAEPGGAYGLALAHVVPVRLINQPLALLARVVVNG
jgi:hypothetical protein